MTVDDVLKEVTDAVRRGVPADVDISAVEFEGATLVVYTKTPEKFADNTDIVRYLAKGLQKRITIRADPSVLADQEKAESEIRATIPKEAEVSDIFFEPETCEVTIEAAKPGFAIGKYGATLNELKKKIGWNPKVIRAPPIPSKSVREIREYLRSVVDDRRAFLRKVGRKIYSGRSNEFWIRLTTLGAFREIGRSCILVTTPNSRILIDCGLNTSSEASASPYLHLPEVWPPNTIDAVIITHAHLDHCGLVPLLFKYGFEGPVYCTPPTRDIMTLLAIDSIKVTGGEGHKVPYESENIREMIKHCITLNYGDTTDVSPDVKLTMWNAGHILGSSSAHLHFGDGQYNMVFSGDIKYEQTWLFDPATNKFPRIEALVMEATYGGPNDFQPSRREAVDQVKDIVGRTLAKKGKVMIPAFAVGRSQEVMLVLQSLMASKQLPEVPVYLDGMIWEATAIHAAYPEYLNYQLRNDIFHMGENPFLSKIFQRVDSGEMREKILNDPDSCIVIGTAGMMNGGPIMEYFKQWAPDPKNTLLFVGYQAEGTMGRRIQNGMKELQLGMGKDQKIIKINLNVETCDGFSGHSDRRQLMNYIYDMRPQPEIILIGHGEAEKCIQLSSSLHKQYGMETRALMNLETVRFK